MYCLEVMAANNTRVVDPSVDLQLALSMLGTGEGLWLSPGDYFLRRPLTLNAQFLQGPGPEKVRINGVLMLRGGAWVHNITLAGPADDHAVRVIEGTSMIEGCPIEFPDGHERAAVAIEGGKLEMVGCQIPDNDSSATIACGEGEIDIRDSAVGYLSVHDGGQVQVRNSRIGGVRMVEASRMRLEAGCILQPAGGDLAMHLQDGSALTAPWLRVDASDVEFKIADSTLHAPRIETRRGEKITVMADVGSDIDVDTTVCVFNSEAQEQGEVIWRAEDGELFDQEVAPKLFDGALIHLQAGHYTLPHTPQARNLKFVGPGRDECLLWVRNLEVTGEQRVEFSGMSLLQRGNEPLLGVGHKATVNLENVAVVPAQRPTEYVQIAVTGGSLQLKDCVVEATPARGEINVRLADGGRMTSQGSFLGWVRMDDAEASFDLDRVYYVSLDNSQISGSLIAYDNEANYRTIVASGGSRCDLSGFAVYGYDAECFVEDSTFNVEESRLLDQHRIRVVTEGNATVHFPGVHPAAAGAQEEQKQVPEVDVPMGGVGVEKQQAPADMVVMSLAAKGYTFDEEALRAAVAQSSADAVKIERMLGDAIAMRLFRTHGGNLAKASSEERLTITAEDLKSLTK